ncbi:MAG: ADP-forming succinate--CoA ligase subunit beta [Chloroflexi bacterium]|nr:ADP-forming succinate--CoA ligase subunit beta [Chloroflexota bacterium]
MKIHEYQAKAILAEFGVPVPRGKVAATPEEARAVATELGGSVVIKAQVHAGGRGKAGGIKVISGPAEAEQAARQLLGSRLVTHQTGPEGVPVPKVLVEETVDTARELYLGIVVDAQAKMPVIMASEAGGMDIEEVAATAPEKILKAWVSPVMGFQPASGRRLAYGMNLDPALVRPASDLIGNLYRVFTSRDCSLAEINPLVVTRDNKLLALDAKLNVDDNSLFRHHDLADLRDTSQEDPLEVEATTTGVNNYIKLTGNIGCVVNGAGLAMATMDTIKLFGGEPANFLDIGTVNNTDRVVSAMRVLIKDPDVKVIYFNIFGGMARVDVIARGLVEAYKQLDVRVPLVARLTGNGLEEGRQILADAGIRVIEGADMADGARKAVEAARGR